MANLTSLIIFTVFIWGRSLRFTNLKMHIRLMLTAMTADFVLVLALVLYRDALHKVDADMPLILMIHVPIAVITLGLYTLAAYYGFRLYQGDERARRYLRIYDKLLLLFRSLTLITSVLVQILR